MLFEKSFNFLIVFSQQSGSFTLKLRFNRAKLVCIVSAHVVKLQLHRFDQLIDVGIHLLHRLNIVFVLDLDRLLEFNFQFVFVFDDLLASCDLNFNVL